jgi:S-adenosylmethionine:tRNA ribosyltransferase-isomerase
VGDRIDFGHAFHGAVMAVSPISPRLVVLELDQTDAAMWSAIYSLGRPVQYAHVPRPIDVWHVQSVYASRPWAAEMPSAGRPITFALLLELRRRGVILARLTHAAGLSSTGDPQLDAALPMTEAYDIPEETATAVARANASGRRVVATGTSVVRALEGCATAEGKVVPGLGETSLILGAAHRLRVVDGILTGMHERSETHFGLLRAFASAEVLERALCHADRAGYLSHEFGDSMLLL